MLKFGKDKLARFLRDWNRREKARGRFSLLLLNPDTDQGVDALSRNVECGQMPRLGGANQVIATCGCKWTDDITY